MPHEFVAPASNLSQKIKLETSAFSFFAGGDRRGEGADSFVLAPDAASFGGTGEKFGKTFQITANSARRPH